MRTLDQDTLEGPLTLSFCFFLYDVMIPTNETLFTNPPRGDFKGGEHEESCAMRNHQDAL